MSAVTKPLSYRPTGPAEKLLVRAIRLTGKNRNKLINEAIAFYLGPKYAGKRIKLDVIG